MHSARRGMLALSSAVTGIVVSWLLLFGGLAHYASLRKDLLLRPSCACHTSVCLRALTCTSQGEIESGGLGFTNRKEADKAA